MTDVHPPLPAVREVVARALAEDLGTLGEDGVLAGRLCAAETFAQVDPSVVVLWSADDGEDLEAGQALAAVEGPLASILIGERTALNLLCHLSGVASLTRRYVRAAAGKARIRDTRKTTPGLRALEKAAVRAGGGVNHRGSLADGILIKDNHLAGLSIETAVRRARLRWPGRSVQVECDTRAQLAADADMVLLDNMSPADVAACVEHVAGRCLVEVSGGVTLDTAGAYADAGADLVSVGAITHSAPVLDIGLDLPSRD